ncbi:hypothetical protein RND71_015660 [Anisodus tanguticus]|uniref:Uncharacterized protein n=1 Tax=Anisodus tanguticus TaxID=243964 RepID=A0AAE1S6Y1_9SOLA|nr:hypothetical protein RND71_015660 [Anisodus tanguticus]
MDLLDILTEFSSDLELRKVLLIAGGVSSEIHCVATNSSSHKIEVPNSSDNITRRELKTAGCCMMFGYGWSIGCTQPTGVTKDIMIFVSTILPWLIRITPLMVKEYKSEAPAGDIQHRLLLDDQFHHLRKIHVKRLSPRSVNL